MSKLKNLRIDRKKKLREVAAALNLTPQTVQQQEKRGIRSQKTPILYEKYYKWPPEELIEWPT